MKKHNIMISEIKKAERAYDKKFGTKSMVGGYGCKWEEDFTELVLEMDDRETGHRLGTVILQACMFDRRRSWVSAAFEV